MEREFFLNIFIDVCVSYYLLRYKGEFYEVYCLIFVV